MNKKPANVKQRKLQNKKLEEETKKMEEELERIRKFKALQIEKEKLKLQMKQLENQNKPVVATKSNQNQVLRGYGQKLKKQTQIKAKKKLQNFKLPQSNSSIQQHDDDDTQNLKYFMSVVGLPQYFDVLIENKINTMVKLRQMDQAATKNLGIPLKDMIKINKKLRSMGY